MKYNMLPIDKDLLRRFLRGREEDSHKRDYGHALLVCGCEQMPGAAVLATGAALKSGCGLVTLHSTATACAAAMASCPSAMLSRDRGDVVTTVPDGLRCRFCSDGATGPGRYQAIGIGPGLGQDPRTAEVLRGLMQAASDQICGLVLDADALNIISASTTAFTDLLSLIPEHSVLTPHMGELRRLLRTDVPTEEDIIALCEKTRSAIVVKGPHTRVFVPGCTASRGVKYVNTTGNPGLAKGGSGDVLTGLITGLLARGYLWYEAAILGVWLHGYAADCLSAERTQECWNSRDLLDYLHRGFIELTDDGCECQIYGDF